MVTKARRKQIAQLEAEVELRQAKLKKLRDEDASRVWGVFGDRVVKLASLEDARDQINTFGFRTKLQALRHLLKLFQRDVKEWRKAQDNAARGTSRAVRRAVSVATRITWEEKRLARRAKLRP